MSRILRNIIFVFLLACAGTLQAQQLKVVEFRADMSMTDATRYPKNDYSGDRCGLIKLGLALPMSDVTFEGDIISTEYKEGEWWIYMPRGSNWLTIKSKSSTYLPLRYEFEGIQSNVTYVMTVEKPSPGPEPEVVREQYLIFQIKPADAVLEVNDQLWTVSAEGIARKFVSFGTYSYRVQAPNYYSETGTVTVDDPKNKKTVPINLRPNFGWVEVKGGNVQGAAVYVDNAYVGKAPCKSEALKSGEHTVRIAKEMYAPYSGKVTISDNETSTLSPTLTADFAKITLSVDADAEIWVNEEKKGTRTWTGNLATGTYRVECRLANHETKATTIEITDKMDGQTIPLSAPKPICGSLNVESTPDFAKIYVDGKPMGETPNFIPQLLIGQHELKLTKEGYADYIETITVAKNERKQINATLSNGKEIQFTCNVPNAQLEIDGQKVGSATGTYKLTYGNHSLKATATDYCEYSNTITISENSSGKHNINMDKLSSQSTVSSTGISVKSFRLLPMDMTASSLGGKRIDQNGEVAALIRIVTSEKGFVFEGGTLGIVDTKQENGEIWVWVPRASRKITIMHQQLGVLSDYRFPVEIEAERSYEMVLGTSSSPIRLEKDEEIFTVNGVSFTMKLVEGGTFQMGGTSEQGSDASDKEKPIHNVTLNSYYMGETEVTQALWKAVMGSNPSKRKGNNLPVEQVSWNDCQEFISKLNQKTGKNFRLPTEAEWEFAARGGKKSKGYKYSGSNTIKNVAWYTETTNDSGTKTVKMKSPNELGLYDMSGNVDEWCQDWNGSYSSGSQINPTGPSTGSTRVRRGGNWLIGAGRCRVSYRDNSFPGSMGSTIGFRLCLP